MEHQYTSSTYTVHFEKHAYGGAIVNLGIEEAGQAPRTGSQKHVYGGAIVNSGIDGQRRHPIFAETSFSKNNGSCVAVLPPQQQLITAAHGLPKRLARI